MSYGIRQLKWLERSARGPSVVTALLVAFMSLTACKSSEAVFIGANHPAIQYVGRWDKTDPLRPRASWPGFYMTVSFTGRSIGVRMNDSSNFYNTYIDGVSHGIMSSKGRGDHDYIVSSGLSSGTHTLRLSRRNISFDPPTVISGLLLEKGAALIPSPINNAKLKIEFIGDSFTAAEGNEASVPTLPWQAKHAVTNIEQGFAAMIAREYDADYVTVCRSGGGLICDWRGSRKSPMKERYRSTLMDALRPRWEFKDTAPDLVVVCLGLNDYSGLKLPDGSVSEKDAREFREAYRDFLTELRSRYPTAHLLALAPHAPWVQQQIQQIAGLPSADRKLHHAHFDYFPGGYVADGHPSVATHRKIADQVLRQMKNFLPLPAQRPGN